MAIESAATLLEREAELAELDDALGAAEAGRGNVVLLEAPAGLGKTSLLRAASESAAERGVHVPAGPGRRARARLRLRLRAPIAGAGRGEGRRSPSATTCSRGAAALSRPLFAPEACPRPAADGAFSVLHGLYWLLNNLADEGPVALFVDDLHWADTESLRFLNYLAPRLDGLAVAVLATARPGEGDTGAIARLAAAPETRTMRPPPAQHRGHGHAVRAQAGNWRGGRLLGGMPRGHRRQPLLPGGAAARGGRTGLRHRRRRSEAGARHRARCRGPGGAAAPRPDGRRPRRLLVQAAAVLGDGAGLAEAARLAEVPEPEAAQRRRLAGRPGDPEAGRPARVRAPDRAGGGVRRNRPSRAGRRPTRAPRGSSPTAARPTSGSRRRSWRRSRPAIPSGWSCCGGSPRARSCEERRRRPPHGCGGRWPSPRCPRREARSCSSWDPRSSGSARPRPSSTSRLRGELLRVDPAQLAMSVRQLALALTISGRADRSLAALEGAIEVVEPVDRELGAGARGRAGVARPSGDAWRRAPRRRGGSSGTATSRAQPPASAWSSRASRASVRARSETAAEAAGHLEGALAEGRLLAEQDVDVGGPFYDIVVGPARRGRARRGRAGPRAGARRRAGARVDPGRRVPDEPPRLGLAAARRRGAGGGRRAHRARAAHDPRDPARPAVRARAARAGTGRVRGARRGRRGNCARADLGEDVLASPTSNFFFEARALLRRAQGRTREGLDDLYEFGRRDELWGVANPLASRWRSRAALAHLTLGEVEERARTGGRGPGASPPLGNTPWDRLGAPGRRHWWTARP